MSVSTRVVGAITVLSLAAIPVAALTLGNSSSNTPVSIDQEDANQAAAAAEAVPDSEDCAADCLETGSLGLSQLITPNATIETNGAPAVTAAVPMSQRLVPQNPVADLTDDTNGSVSAPKIAKVEDEAQRPAKPRRVKKKVQKGAAPGSFELLFDGLTK